MRLDQLIAGSNASLVRGRPDLDITGIVEDSRQAAAGCLFIARSGTKDDGRAYIQAAIAAGAAAVLTADPQAIPHGTAALIAADPAEAGATLAERFHNNPSSKLKLVGITGTNGKTTIAFLIHQFLNRAGMTCGLMGTVHIDDGRTTVPANLTTPSAIEISTLLAAMVRNGCKACVMESSSHALHQKRTAGLAFKAGVFTNLTGDHLDYHKSMDAYRDAKAILFASLPANGVAVLNADDLASDAMAIVARARIIRCSTSTSVEAASAESRQGQVGKDVGRADCTARTIQSTIKHTRVAMRGPWGEWNINLPLIGGHNVMNALQALATAHALGVPVDSLRETLETCVAPPGRLEPVTTADDPFTVLVDYAHSDDALENVLRSLRPLVMTGASLRVVFGCGGDRDRTKRPRMAAVACRWADDVIITSDNPRTEDPQSIIEMIRAGVPNDRLGQMTSQVDRAAAIALALERAAEGDIILIAGKGHEDYQIIGTTRRPFDDRRIAAAALADSRVRATVA